MELVTKSGGVGGGGGLFYPLVQLTLLSPNLKMRITLVNVFSYIPSSHMTLDKDGCEKSHVSHKSSTERSIGSGCYSDTSHMPSNKPSRGHLHLLKHM